jgi:hypothetical protein
MRLPGDKEILALHEKVADADEMTLDTRSVRTTRTRK